MNEAPKYSGTIILLSTVIPKEVEGNLAGLGINRFVSKMGSESAEVLEQQDGKVVAIVDDNQIATRASEGLLKVCNTREVVVFTGPQAPYDALNGIPLHQPPIEVVLLDYQMPGMNGDEVARRLRTGDRLGL